MTTPKRPRTRAEIQQFRDVLQAVLDQLDCTQPQTLMFTSAIGALDFALGGPTPKMTTKG